MKIPRRAAALFARRIHPKEMLPVNLADRNGQEPLVLTDDVLNGAIERAHARFRKNCAFYQKGLIGPDELRDANVKVFSGGFFDFLRGNSRFGGDAVVPPLLILVTPASWERFCEDYAMWKAGELPQSEKGLPYLRCKRACPEKGIAEGQEASAADKAQFFRMMDAFLTPPEYFEPLREGCPVPFKSFGVYGTGDLVHVQFFCADDGGLRAAGTGAAGRWFVLTDRRGPRAELEILDAPERPGGEFRAVGTIEGITLPRRREIEVSFREPPEVWLRTHIERDEQDVFASYPLWQEYRAFCSRKEALLRGILDRIAQHFGEEPEKT